LDDGIGFAHRTPGIKLGATIGTVIFVQGHINLLDVDGVSKLYPKLPPNVIQLVRGA
jgi:hypothetical protein